jgi:hypothetical protein
MKIHVLLNCSATRPVVGVKMPRRPCTFRQRDVTAALKAAAAAGMRVAGFKVNPQGEIEVVIGKPAEQDSTNNDRRGEWDGAEL